MPCVVWTKLDTSARQTKDHQSTNLQPNPSSVNYGTLCCKAETFGVVSSPAIFQGIMDQVLQGLNHVVWYLDDYLAHR